MRIRSVQWDLLGISVSVLCALHCVGLPLLLSSFTLLGSQWLHNPWLEVSMIVISLLLGVLSFYRGCFVQHKNKLPLLLFVPGVALLLLNQQNERHAFYLIPAATVLIAVAHFINYRKCRQSCATIRPEAKRQNV